MSLKAVLPVPLPPATLGACGDSPDRVVHVHLDRVNSQELIAECEREPGLGVLHVMHDRAEARRAAARTLRLEEGELIGEAAHAWGGQG